MYFLSRALVCLFGFSVALSKELPSFITPCPRSSPVAEFNSCILNQAKNALPYFAKGVPDLGIDPIDPLSVDDFSVKTGSLAIKQKNAVLYGLGEMEIVDLKWSLADNIGVLRVYGNLSMISDYETEGRILVIPITGAGKLTVNMYNSEILMKYKLKKIQGPDGQEHLASYDLKAKQTYQKVTFRMISNLGENILSDTINRVLNDNWRDLMKELGPPHTKAISARVSQIINVLYSNVPYDVLLPNTA